MLRSHKYSQPSATGHHWSASAGNNIASMTSPPTKLFIVHPGADSSSVTLPDELITEIFSVKKNLSLI
jgi:hypothetical protein